MGEDMYRSDMSERPITMSEVWGNWTVGVLGQHL